MTDEKEGGAKSKVIKLEKRKREMHDREKLPDDPVSEEEFDLQLKIGDLEALLMVSETLIEEIRALEKKVQPGDSRGISKFYNRWNNMVIAFENYSDARLFYTE